MRTDKILVLAVAVSVLFAACGADETTRSTSAPPTTPATAGTPTTGATLQPVGSGELGRFVWDGWVLDKQGAGPQLCAAVLTSLPPQCEGLPVAGLDWDDVPWAESAGDTTWAEVHASGTFDGKVFTLTEPPAAPEPLPDLFPDRDFTTPCSQPDGGWAVSDPSSELAFEAARTYAEAQPDFAGLWVDQLLAPGERENEEHDPGVFVANFTFTGDLDRHRAALAGIYGGPSCVSLGPRPLADLCALQARVFETLGGPEAEAAGIYGRFGMSGSANQFRGVVEVSVMVVTGDGAQAWLDEEFGPGLVEVRSYLRPAT